MSLLQSYLVFYALCQEPICLLSWFIYGHSLASAGATTELCCCFSSSFCNHWLKKKAADHTLRVKDQYLGRLEVGQNCLSFSSGYMAHAGWLYRLNSGERHKYVTDGFFSPSRASQSSPSEISFLMEDHLLQTHTVVSKCLPNAVPSNTQGRWNKLRKYTTCFSICLVHCISQHIVYSQFYCSPAWSVRFWFCWGFYMCVVRDNGGNHKDCKITK